MRPTRHAPADIAALAFSWRQLVMIIVACVLLYLGLVKKFEPLLLVGIAFGMLLTNLPGSEMYHPELWDAYIAGQIRLTDIIHDGGLLDILYIGVKSGVYPSLIFMGVGAMTDFGPLIANPKTAILGGAAQFGVFFTLFGGIEGYQGFDMFCVNSDWMTFLVIPFMFLYNGEEGRKSSFNKWFFYAFYPIHLWVLMILSVVL